MARRDLEALITENREVKKLLASLGALLDVSPLPEPSCSTPAQDQTKEETNGYHRDQNGRRTRR